MMGVDANTGKAKKEVDNDDDCEQGIRLHKKGLEMMSKGYKKKKTRHKMIDIIGEAAKAAADAVENGHQESATETQPFVVAKDVATEAHSLVVVIEKAVEENA
eukprot:gnl/TRDRNA2_/TRDRNA2_173042_c1_seq4.p5 gnl/TRDRNA2_/TRDRNA2_173042_c1~~gnl/TRDRNA2_/TRDRNA2_173042_c1_seq4.p5  ORF type:complete len:103 (-),score=38.11 gnl/TRDRNA2_/TRDRNA2_173042_c1_seq4:235-543(-)